MRTLLILSYGFSLLALSFSFALAQSSPDLGPVGPKTDSTNPEIESPPAKPAVDLPYKPTPTKPAPNPEDDSMGEEGDPVHYVRPVEIIIPYISSKSPEPQGAPDPEY